MRKAIAPWHPDEGARIYYAGGGAGDARVSFRTISSPVLDRWDGVPEYFFPRQPDIRGQTRTLATPGSCGLMWAQFESMVKRMQHGFASHNGLTAAALAASGCVGIKRVFEREYGGWLSTFGEGHHPDSSQIYAGLAPR